MLTDLQKNTLRRDDLTRAEFFGVFYDAARAALPDLQVLIVGDLELLVRMAGGAEQRVYLHNAWDSCHDDPEQRAPIIEHRLTLLLRAIASDDGMETIMNEAPMLPMIKSDSFVRDAQAQFGEKAVLASRPFVADLHVVFVRDLPDQIVYLTSSHEGFEETLGDDAIARTMPAFKEHIRDGFGLLGTDGVFMVQLDNCYEATLLLHDELWDNLLDSLSFDGPPIASVPRRGSLLLADSANEEAVTALRTLTRQHHDEGPYSMSLALLHRPHHHWTLYGS